VKHLLIWFVKFWRAVVSPTYGNVCKYYPSCSEYGLEALQIHGAIKGTGLMVWRILRCNPWSLGGVDPVPGSELAAKVAEWWPEDKRVTDPRGVGRGVGPDMMGSTCRAGLPVDVAAATKG